MPDDPIVELRSLTHRYGSRVALDDVSFDVPQATLFALLGPNGGGKTTLFRILATLLTPTSGGGNIVGADILHQRDRVRESIGVVFQKPSLDVHLTVMENLQHQGHLYGLFGETLKRKSMTLLDRFGLADRAGDRVKTLSGGSQRRVELAKALLHEPRVLILDEPSTGLDPAARFALMDHLNELRRRDGVTALITTHLMDEAQRYDQVGILDRGRLVALDRPSVLTAAIGGDVLTVSASDPADLADKASQRWGVKAEVMDGQVRIERERGHDFVPDLIEAFPGRIDSVTVGKPTLDDVFVHLTGHRLTNDETSKRLNRNGAAELVNDDC